MTIPKFTGQVLAISEKIFLQFDLRMYLLPFVFVSMHMIWIWSILMIKLHVFCLFAKKLPFRVGSGVQYMDSCILNSVNCLSKLSILGNFIPHIAFTIYLIRQYLIKVLVYNSQMHFWCTFPPCWTHNTDQKAKKWVSIFQ